MFSEKEMKKNKKEIMYASSPEETCTFCVSLEDKQHAMEQQQQRCDTIDTVEKTLQIFPFFTIRISVFIENEFYGKWPK